MNVAFFFIALCTIALLVSAVPVERESFESKPIKNETTFPTFDKNSRVAQLGGSAKTFTYEHSFSLKASDRFLKGLKRRLKRAVKRLRSKVKGIGRTVKRIRKRIKNIGRRFRREADGVSKKLMKIKELVKQVKNCIEVIKKAKENKAPTTEECAVGKKKCGKVDDACLIVKFVLKKPCGKANDVCSQISALCE